MNILSAILSEFGGAALTVIVSLLGAAGAYFMGKSKAKNEANEEALKREGISRTQAAERTVEVLEKVQDVQTKINTLPSGAAADKLRNEWARD